jgi:DNA-binding MarR family transcriptional regulator
MFLIGTLVSQSSSRKYIHYLKMKNLICIIKSKEDKRVKLVNINDSIRNKIDSYL